MRKLVAISICLFLFISFIYSADDVKAKIFVKTTYIVKIFNHQLGYKVIYQKEAFGSFGEFYIPFSWFSEKGGQGEIIWGKDYSYPYFSIFWIDNKFDHIKLFLQDDINHITWGTLHQSVADVQAKFNITPETFKIEF